MKACGHLAVYCAMLLEVSARDHTPQPLSVGTQRARVLQAEDGDEGAFHVSVREGVLVQSGGCPQAISREEAAARVRGDALPGSVITLGSLDSIGKAGNHFVTISSFFSMAYCCQSKVLVMPGEDSRFPTVNGRILHPDRCWFDFSSGGSDGGVDDQYSKLATIQPEFADLAERPDVCPPVKAFSGPMAYFLVDVHPDLLSCMNRVFVPGCEAEYLHPVLDTSDFCEPRPWPPEKPAQGDIALASTSSSQRGDADVDSGSGPSEAVENRAAGNDNEEEEASSVADTTIPSEQWGHNRRRRWRRLRGRTSTAAENSRKGTPARRTSDLATNLDTGSDVGDSSSNRTEYSGGGPGERAGSLVMHIRSGDIFLRNRRYFPQYGQPPVQYFVDVIGSKQWADVSILTSAASAPELNPTFSALKEMNSQGLLGPNVAMYDDRPLLVDLRAMLCADGLAVARSSMEFVTVAHSRARHLFLPAACGHGTYSRAEHSVENYIFPVNPDNSTLLCLQRPEAKVYGIEWDTSREPYSVYNAWNITDEQLVEMVTYDGIKGIQRCCV